MDVKIKFIMLCVLVAESTGDTLQFPVTETVETICADVPAMTVIDNHVTSGGGSSIFYTLTGNETDYFDVDHTTGAVYIVKDPPQRHFNGSRIVLYKQAVDQTGSVAEMKLILNLASPVIHIATCPTILSRTVRETAAISEEIDLVECSHNQPRLGLEEHKITSIKIIDVVSRINPFDVTKDGVIVVAKPLVYRNNIDDIYIMNVTMVFLKGHGNPATNCSRTETKVTVKIEVRKADCPPAKIQYELRKNVYLDYPAFITFPSCTLDECTNVCTNKSSSCHSFNYNVVKRECRLLNETEYTLNKATFRRLGVFLYRRYCQTEPLPSAALRRILDKVENNAVFSAVNGLFVMQQLKTAVQKSRNITLQDLNASASVVTCLLNKTDLSTGSFQDVKNYAQFCCLLLDMLIVRATDSQTQEEDSLLNIFDSLIKLLSNDVREQWAIMNIVSNFTAIKLRHVGNQYRVNLNIQSTTGTSEIDFDWSSDNMTKDNNTVMVVGTVEGLGDIIKPKMAYNAINHKSGNFLLDGHMISIIINPAKDEPFEKPLQLDVFTGNAKKSTGRNVCAYLVETTSSIHNEWDVDGCWFVNKNDTHTRCHCSHMTNFAVLMQVTYFQLSDVNVASLELLTIVGCCISIIALSTTVVVLMWLRLRSERYILLLHLSVAVILAQIVFLTGIDAVEIKPICRLVAILLHYLYLSVFTLMLAEGIHLFHKLHRAFNADDNLTLLLILGWGTPFVIVSLSLLSSGDGYTTENNCWLSTHGAIWSFVGPALTIIAINMSILVIVIRTFLGVTIVAKKSDMQKFKASLKATVVLLPLLGVTWMFGVAAVNNSTVIFQYVFAILNSLQGLFIFLFHVVFNEDVKKACNQYRRHVTSVDSILPSPDTARNCKASRYKEIASM